MLKKAERRKVGMASVDCMYTPAYKEDELGFKLMRSRFADRAHDVYLVYDDQMDQIIVRLVAPAVFASEYYINDDIALLVRERDREVVGFTIVNFVSEYLPKNAPHLLDLWQENRLASKLAHYLKTRYQPDRQKKGHIDQKPEQSIFVFSAYQSKAAAELVMA
jgi:hypothetical protein